jgi:hypothetical protein
MNNLLLKYEGKPALDQNAFLKDEVSKAYIDGDPAGLIA